MARRTLPHCRVATLPRNLLRFQSSVRLFAVQQSWESINRFNKSEILVRLYTILRGHEQLNPLRRDEGTMGQGRVRPKTETATSLKLEITRNELSLDRAI